MVAGNFQCWNVELKRNIESKQVEVKISDFEIAETNETVEEIISFGILVPVQRKNENFTFSLT